MYLSSVEIRPLRDEEHRSHNRPVAELLDLIPPFTFVPRKQIFSRFFDTLSLQLIFFRSCGATANVGSGADWFQTRSCFLPGKVWFSNDGMLVTRYIIHVADVIIRKAPWLTVTISSIPWLSAHDLE